MAKDYAKRATTKRASSQKKGLSIDIHWRWFGAGFVLGGLAIGIILVLLSQSWNMRTATTPMPIEAVMPNEQLESLADNEEPLKPQFNFYSLLPDMAVSIPDSSDYSSVAEIPNDQNNIEAPVNPEAQQITETQVEPDLVTEIGPESIDNNEADPVVAETAPQVETQEVDNAHYELQLAAFKAETDADTFRAGLVLLGYDVHIQDATTQEGEVWYRIRVGPFADRKLAEQTQARLQGEDIASLLLQVNG